MSAPSRKRARIEDEDGDGDRDSNPPTSALQKDDDMWLSDGSIVVAAADHVAFRVHKSTLARRSEIFRDLFSLPNADAATSETMEGCQIVRVSDLSEDIRHLLLVLCCGKNYYYDGDTLIAVPFEILVSLIRMAHKYAVHDVLDHALSRLKKYYTNDLAAWRDAESRARYVTAQNHHALTVIALARLTSTPSLLPTAFLQCTTLLTTYQAEGDVPLSLAIASLSVSDQLMLIGAREHLLHVCSERPLRLLAAARSRAANSCTSPTICQTVRAAPLTAMREGSLFPGLPPFRRDVLQPVAATLWGGVHWGMFCPSCRAVLMAVDEEESHWIWSVLPRMFGLRLDADSWPSLVVDGA